MSNAAIRAGLENVLAAWAQAQAPPIPVAWQNQAFTPPPARYIRAFLLPGKTASYDMDGEQRVFVGVWQVSLCMPLGSGSADAQTLEAAICALYPKETPITASGVTTTLKSPMSAGPSIPNDTHYTVPISCSYQAFT